MTQADFLQWLPAAAGSIIAFCVAYIVNDFKSFKEKSEREFKELARAREEALSSMRGLALEVGQKVASLEVVHVKYEASVQLAIQKINAELHNFEKEIANLNKTARSAEEIFKKAFELAQALNQKVHTQEKELKSIQIKMGETTIFKSKK